MLYVSVSQTQEDNTESQSMTAADEQARYRKVMQNVPQPGEYIQV